MSGKQDNYEMLDTSPQASFPYKRMYFLVFLLAVSFTVFYTVVLRKTQDSKLITEVQPSATPISTPSSSPPVSSKPTVATVNETIYFDFDTAQISSSQLVKLRSFWSTIQGKTGELIIKGYSDDLGPSDYNQWLSTARAESIVRSLHQLSVERQNYQITVKGYGESQFILQEEIEKAR